MVQASCPDGAFLLVVYCLNAIKQSPYTQVLDSWRKEGIEVSQRKVVLKIISG